MTRNKVKISEIADVEAGFAWKSEKFSDSSKDGLPIIRIQNLGGNENAKFVYYNDPYDDKYIVQYDDLLVSLSGSFKIYRWDGPKALLNQRIVRIIPKENIVLKDYLYFYIFRKVSEIQRKAQGVAVANASMGTVRNMPIPLPSLREQKRIVEVLEKADALRKKRQEAYEVINSGIMSIALNLFGGPIRNPKKWAIRKFSEIALLERGRFGHRPRTEPRFYGGKYPFIQINDITKSGMIIKEYSQTLNEKGLAISKLFPANTVVVSIASTIGEVGILGFDSCFPDSLVGITPKEEAVTKEYIYFYLVYMKSHLNEIAPQLAQKNINLKILSNLNVPVPVLSEQQKFTDLVQKVENIKEKQLKSRQELDNLFNSLMQGMFKG
jgi:type I restriction enzyme S subunit